MKPDSLSSEIMAWDRFVRLVSLWEVLKTYAYDLVAIERALGGIAGLFALVGNAKRQVPQQHPEDIVNMQEAASHIEENVKKAVLLSKELGLCSTYVQLERVARDIGHYTSDHSRLAHELGQITQRLEDDLRAIYFYHVPLSKYDYYANLFFGEDVGSRFPDCLDDAREAGRCFALGRYSGVVLHCMGVVQTGLEELARHLGVRVDVQVDDWNNIITKIEGGISRRKKKILGLGDKPSTRQKSKWAKVEPFYSEIVGEVRAIKNAWRNPGFHFRRRDFDEPKAREVLDRVRDFMRNMATNLPSRKRQD